MNRLARLIQWRTVIFFVCGIVLLASGGVTCSPPSDVNLSQPTAVAAQSLPPPVGEINISRQPFVTIAKQARASVVNISSVKKITRKGEPFINAGCVV